MEIEVNCDDDNFKLRYLTEFGVAELKRTSDYLKSQIPMRDGLLQRLDTPDFGSGSIPKNDLPKADFGPNSFLEEIERGWDARKKDCRKWPQVVEVSRNMNKALQSVSCGFFVDLFEKVLRTNDRLCESLESVALDYVLSGKGVNPNLQVRMRDIGEKGYIEKERRWVRECAVNGYAVWMAPYIRVTMSDEAIGDGFASKRYKVGARNFATFLNERQIALLSNSPDSIHDIVGCIGADSIISVDEDGAFKKGAITNFGTNVEESNAAVTFKNALEKTAEIVYRGRMNEWRARDVEEERHI